MSIDWGQLGRLTGDIDPFYLVALGIIGMGRVVVVAWRFTWLANLVTHIRFSIHLKLYFIASYFNVFLPTSVGGDAVRVLLLRDHDLTAQQGITFMLVERFFGILALVALAVTGALLYPLPGEIKLLITGLAFALIVCIVLLLSSKRLLHRLQSRFPVLRVSIDALLLVLSYPRVMLSVFTISCLIAVITTAMPWLVALSLDLVIPFEACMALVPLVWIVTLLPISIGGHGVREAAFVYLFGLIGVTVEASLLISLATFASFVLNGAIGLALFLTERLRLSTISSQLAVNHHEHHKLGPRS